MGLWHWRRWCRRSPTSALNASSSSSKFTKKIQSCSSAGHPNSLRPTPDAYQSTHRRKAHCCSMTERRSELARLVIDRAQDLAVSTTSDQPVCWLCKGSDRGPSATSARSKCPSVARPACFVPWVGSKIDEATEGLSETSLHAANTRSQPVCSSIGDVWLTTGAICCCLVRPGERLLSAQLSRPGSRRGRLARSLQDRRVLQAETPVAG